MFPPGNSAMAISGSKDQKHSLGHVLVVEDDTILALDLSEALREHGARHVNVCATSHDALEALRTTKPDHVILDVHLADRDDGWAIAELLDTMGGSAPNVIFATGAPQAIPEHIAKLGPVLEKPYEADQIVAALSQNRPGMLGRLRDALRK